MSGPIALNGMTVFGFVEADQVGLRVRVSADDWERLGLIPGQQVRVDGPGRDPGRYLLTAAEQTPPLVWLRMLPLSARQAG